MGLWLYHLKEVIARMAHMKATTLMWKNKATMLLPKPNTNNIQNNNIGVLLKMPLHGLFNEEEN